MMQFNMIDEKTRKYLVKMGATSFLTPENIQKLDKLTNDITEFERQFKIKLWESWKSAADVVINA